MPRHRPTYRGARPLHLALVLALIRDAHKGFRCECEENERTDFDSLGYLHESVEDAARFALEGRPLDPADKSILRAFAAHQCDNCDRVYSYDQLVRPIRDYDQRVERGEPRPGGECPACGALCHRVTTLDRFAVR